MFRMKDMHRDVHCSVVDQKKEKNPHNNPSAKKEKNLYLQKCN